MQLRHVGLMLGLMAWCMQLVVFVQPFLPGHTVPGFGVCQTIIDVFKPSVVASEKNKQHSLAINKNNSHEKHDIGVNSTFVSLVDSSQLQQATALPVHTVDHYFSHLSCGFCTLYGHAIPPPALQPLWLTAIFSDYISVTYFSEQTNFALAPAYLKPKSRAPPHYII
ncbi:hypothetical protein ACF3NA_00285 [Alkanindiges sp. WGS2144]|uniref:hypothetical protein n=1 Tax=Alkanindiges sp. WGS2144 TaxID=3366808 RepID=UPI00375272E0